MHKMHSHTRSYLMCQSKNAHCCQWLLAGNSQRTVHSERCTVYSGEQSRQALKRYLATLCHRLACSTSPILTSGAVFVLISSSVIFFSVQETLSSRHTYCVCTYNPFSQDGFLFSYRIIFFEPLFRLRKSQLQPNLLATTRISEPI